MSDEVTRQLREEREDAIDAFHIAFERLQRLGIEHPPKRREPTLTDRINEHCRLVAEAEEEVKSTTPFPAQLALDELRSKKQEPGLADWAMTWGVRLCMAMGAK